jgi:hypothetical protein
MRDERRYPMDEVVAFLEHHGIKGMKWGVRKRAVTLKSNLSKPTPVEVVAKPGKRIVVTGGKRNPTHGDAITVSKLQQRHQKSGKQALSNQEIKKLNERLSLEQQLDKLDPRVTRGQKVLNELLYGQTPALALTGAKHVLKDKIRDQDPKTLKGLAMAEMIINNRPQAPKKKKK